MTRPVIIRRPKLVAQPLDAAGAATGSPVELSCDIRSVALEPSQSLDTVKTFCGVFTVAGDVEVGCTVAGVLTDDTATNWGPLVGDSVEIQIYDRDSDTTYRKFVSEIPFDPSLYGTDDADATEREWSMELPVLSDVTWGGA